MSEAFDARWLALRARADARARDEAGLAGPLRHALARRGAPLRVLDLGGGTGANLRYLASRLGGPQRWCVVDRDAALLGEVRAPEGAREGGVEVTTLVADLGTVEGRTRLAAWADADLVSSSALFDLAAGDVVHALTGMLRPRAWLAALEVDGGMTLDPSDPSDDAVVAAFHRDQRRPKGLGVDPVAPALGADAADALAERLEEAGYRVTRSASPWRLHGTDRDDRALLGPWLAGVAGAAARARPEAAHRVQAWHAARRAHLASGRLSVRVGHVDVLGVAR